MDLLDVEQAQKRHDEQCIGTGCWHTMGGYDRRKCCFCGWQYSFQRPNETVPKSIHGRYWAV